MDSTKNEDFGLSAENKMRIQSILKNYLRIKPSYQIYVFGSRANGTQQKYSDIDLWIEATPSVTKDDIFELSRLFADSELTIKVDIVSTETCLAEYKSRIISERKFWF